MRALLFDTAPILWLLRVVWVTMPFTLGSALSGALADQTSPTKIVVGLLAWAIWAGALGASLVLRPITLTAVRVLVPISVPAAIWALWPDGQWGATTLISLAAALIATYAALAASSGNAFVDGASYGDEQRMTLRVPGPLTPIVVAVWAAIVTTALGGPILLAARWWVLGSLALVLGPPVGFIGLRALHSLARRWVVFVPAGMVLHDHLSLVTPVLFSRQTIATMSPAVEPGTAVDFTQGAFGLAVGVQLHEEVSATLADGRGKSHQADITAFIFAPTRPGAVLAHAQQKRLLG